MNTSACGLNAYTFAPGQIYNFHFSYSASRHLNFVTNGVSNFDPDVNTAGLSVWLTANSAAGANCGTSANNFAQIAPLTTDVMVFQNLNIPYITQFNGGNQNNGLPLIWLPADITFTYNGIPGQDQIRWQNTCTPNVDPAIVGESVDINIDDVEIFCNTILNVGFSQIFTNDGLTSVFSDITQPTNGVTICQWNWDFGDGTNSNSQNPSHDYINAGNYQVCLDVIDSRGCTWYQDKMYFAPALNFAPSSKIDNSGLKQAIQDSFFSLSPNPAEDVVNIEVIEDTQELFNCMVTDINGRVMYSEKLSKKAIIPTFEWVSGVYFVRLQSNTKISVKQLIINR